MKSAWVECTLRCTSCGEAWSELGLARLAWGAVRSADPLAAITYQVGDRIVWFVDRSGVAPADSVTPDGCANLGDPSLFDIDVLDPGPSRCPRCGCAHAGTVVRIRNGRINGAELVSSEVADATGLDPERIAYRVYAGPDAFDSDGTEPLTPGRLE